MDWGTVGAVALGAAVSLISTTVLRRWEWYREQRVRIHLNELPAVRKEISRLEIGAGDPIAESGQVASSTAHALYTVASITSARDRRFAAPIVEAANEIEAIGARYEWHGTPQPTLDERRALGPEQQGAVARLSYEQWLERRLRFGR
ncbi:MAG TPA: hypothetical protein VFI47_16320 [Acidimicrobiales bacterium]|nr:hypothetical protein [Acidimicrobiales bacterium]